MKNFYALFACICTTLFFNSCVKTRKEYCTELSTQCEISKDYILFKILDAGEATDAYGKPLINNDWYAYVTKKGVFVPFYSNMNNIINATELDNLIKKTGSFIHIDFKTDTFYRYVTIADVKKFDLETNKALMLITDGYFELIVGIQQRIIVQHYKSVLTKK